MILLQTAKAIYQREYYAKNRELIRSKVNKEDRRKYNEQYRAENPDKIKKKNKKYCKENAEKNRATATAWYNSRTQEEKDVIKARRRELYRQKNPKK